MPLTKQERKELKDRVVVAQAHNDVDGLARIAEVALARDDIELSTTIGLAVARVERRQPARELATQLSDHPDGFVRQLGLLALWMIGSQHSLEVFVGALADPRTECRGYAIMGLQRLGSPEAPGSAPEGLALSAH